MSPFLKRQLIFFMSTLLLMATNVFAQKVKIEGDLESFYEDYAGNTHKLKQYIKDKKGNRYEIKSEKALPITSKSDISLSGKILKRGKNGAHDTLQLDETQESSLFLNAGLAGDNPYPIKGSENAYSMGEQKTLLVLVNFYDNATQSISLEQGQAWFNELDTFVPKLLMERPG